MGGPHMASQESCLRNHWDQCLIYVENVEIFTFPEPAPTQPCPGQSTPRTELVSILGASDLG